MKANDVWLFLGVAAALVGSAFALSALLCGLIRRYSRQWGLLDRPGGHKRHQEPTPLGGGVAIWLTTVILLAMGVLIIRWGGALLPEPMALHVNGARLRLGDLSVIIGLASAIMVMGLIDDLKDLNWRLRLGIQVGCAAILAASGIHVTLFGPFTHPILGGAVTILWIVALTNAFNMLDNMTAWPRVLD